MNKFEPLFTGHLHNQRKAALRMNLAKEKELALMSDEEVTTLINESDYFILSNGENFAILPNEVKNKIIWVNR